MAIPNTRPTVKSDIPTEYQSELAWLMDHWDTHIWPIFSVGGRVIIVGDDGDPIKTEPGGLLITIDYPHHEIHDGNMWEASYATVAETDGNLADNAYIEFGIQTPDIAGAEWHLVFEGSSGGDFELDFYEGSTWTNGSGTAVTLYNRNRQSANATTVTVHRNPALVVPGVNMLEDRIFPGGTGGTSPGTVGGTRDEWILAANTKYLVRMTNRAGNAQPGGLRIMFYRE